MISDEDIQKVSAATDFVALVAETTPVKQKGRDWWCCCPFHKEKTASCKIDPAENLWHCFGCGEGGTVFSYVMKLHDVSFVEAVHMLADRAHIEIEDTGSNNGASTSEKNRLKECCKTACDFFEEQLLRGRGQGSDNGRKYLSSRKFGIDIAKRWHLGYAPGNGLLAAHLQEAGFTPEEIVGANLGVKNGDRVNDRFFNRVMFPIFDQRGDCVAFGGRVIGKGEPKYLNSSETKIFHKSNVLFGLDKAKNTIVTTGFAVVVEGYTDVIAMHEAGIQNAVATLGTSLTMQHIKLLSRYASNKIVYLFDGDEAGQRAAERALQFIDYSMTPEAGQTRCDLHAATIPDNMDPAEYIEAKGAQAMRDILDNSISLIEFGIHRRLSRYNLSTPEGRSRALMDAISILAPIKESVLAKDYAMQIATLTGVSENDALAQLASLKAPKNQNHEQPEVVATAPETPKQSAPVDSNRIKNERVVVAVACQQPSVAIASGDELLGIKWASGLHKNIIEQALSFISDDLNISSAALIAKLSSAIPNSGSVIAAEMYPSAEQAKVAFDIALTNLSIEDLKARQTELRFQLAGASERLAIMKEIDEISKQMAALTMKLTRN